MGIAPYKSFTFDGESSLDYGVYLTGEGVFNAPSRAVEMIEIPGRNGMFALDQGRFENITVTYKAGMFDFSESDFADKMSDFRNWICSKVGYCRLEDDYNPNEYRMAVYSSGLEVDHEMLTAGEFEITFDCKPQRWLTSGETATAISSGTSLTNPTLFDASPQFEVTGYGNINFNGQRITLSDEAYGYVELAHNVNTYTIPSYMVQNGDTIICGDAPISFQAYDRNGNTISSIVNESQGVTLSGGVVKFSGTFSRSAATVGTSSSTTRTVTFTVVTPNDERKKVSAMFTYDYDKNAGSVSITLSWNQSNVSGYSSGTLDIGRQKLNYRISVIAVNSTASVLGTPTYVDCDAGEVYKIIGSEYQSLNQYVSLGTTLPTLPPGATSITFSNTITDLKVVPRWWKL